MLERIKAVLRERREDDQGFSLVELAVVIVIIGILVAIAVPVFMNMQTSARTSAVEAGVANGAATAASGFAAGGDTDDVQQELNKLVAQSDELASLKVSGTEVSDYCVEGEPDGAINDGAALKKGPGCGGTAEDEESGT